MLSNLYRDAISAEKDASFITESVLTDPIENPEEDGVDSESVPQSAVDKANTALDQIVDREDYDDTDLEELLDDDDDDMEISIMITEAVNSAIDIMNEHDANVFERDMSLIEAAAISELNEINTGAFQSIKHVIDGHNKTGNQFLKMAKSELNNGNNKKAKECIDKAIAAYKEARKKAEDIDDDGWLENIVIAAILSIVPTLGSLAYAVGHCYSWYSLRTQADKGDKYSKKHTERKKNLILEFFFGKLRGAGWSRSVILAGYDKAIEECKMLKKSIK